MEFCLPRVLEGPVGGTRLPIRGNQKSEPEEALSGKSLHTNQRNRLLILVTLLAVAGLFRPSLLPMKAEEPEIECPGLTTSEMRFCASQKWEESNEALKEQLTPATLKKWKAATQEVCAAAYAPYRQGTIYPQMVVGCDDRLNRVLLEELNRLWED